jgi:hypothetical protein
MPQRAMRGMMRRLRRARPKVPVVVAFVGVQLMRSPARSTAGFGTDGLDGVDGGEHHPGVMDVGGAHEDRERYALGRPQDGVSCPVCLGPLGSCPFLGPPGPVPRRSPRRPGPSRCDRPGPALQAALGSSDARHLLCTSPAASASTSSAPTAHLGRRVLPGNTGGRSLDSESVQGFGKISKQWMCLADSQASLMSSSLGSILVCRVILPEKHHAAWSGETDDGNLIALLVPYPFD